MIFYYNAGGDLLSAVFEEVYQGSNKATPIYFACTTSSNNTVDLAFELPDGSLTARHVMTAVQSGTLTGVFDGDGREFNVWKYDLPTLITEKKGMVTVQFFVNEIGATVSTAAVQFYVNKGVAGIVPEIGDSYSELVALVSEHSTRIDSVESEMDEKVVKRTANSDYSAVYGFNQLGQTEYKVTSSATASQIPIYDSNANLSTGAPIKATDAANKSYVDVNFGKNIELSMNNSTYVLTLKLKNSSGTAISTQTIDLPLETMVVSGSYNDVTKKVILTLQNGSTVEFSVADLVDGLQAQLTAGNGISIANNVIAVTNRGGTFTVHPSDWNNGEFYRFTIFLQANDKVDIGALTYADQEKINQAQLFVTVGGNYPTMYIKITAQTTPTSDINFQYFITKGVA